MKKLYEPGEKSRAVCNNCARLVPTTFQYRNVPFSDGVGLAENILVAVCDECESVVAVPAQSTPAIRQARELADRSLEVSLPAPEVDILDAAAQVIDPEATPKFRKALFAYYIQALCRDIVAVGVPSSCIRITKHVQNWHRGF